MEALLNVKLIAGLVAAVVVGGVVLVALMLRRVVSTNEVHIVQSARKTTSYGKDTGNGNTYYEWPAWMPLIGVTKIVLPVSVFDLDLTNYEAYDKGRLPFVVDVKAFFRIADSNVAAQRVASFDELHGQLQAVVQGAVRVILASNDIEEIMQGRSKFGDEFTKEVSQQLASWGVTTVKNIELMDLRDSKDSHVIQNIMAKKKSHIEMESRTEVAKNKKTAQIAEIEAQQAIDTQAQAAKQAVGMRTIEAERIVALEKEAQTQAVKEAQKLTKAKELAVTEVERTRAAEIEKSVQLVQAEQGRQTAIISASAAKETALIGAEAEKTKTILVAEGTLAAKKREAEGIAAEGTARAEAEKAMQLAPVQAQITLANEIGGNKAYQQYLITIREIEANQAIGVEQAKVLGNAQVKIIANTGNVAEGLKNVAELVSAKGGVALGAMLEGLAQSDVGQSLITKVVETKAIE